MKKEKTTQNKKTEQEKIKPNKTNLYILMGLIVLFLIGIIVRWDYVSKELKNGFESYFPPTEQVDSVQIDSIQSKE